MVRHLVEALVLCLVASELLLAVSHKDVIAYVFVKDRAIQPGEIDAKRLTRINYAFANIRDGEVVEGFAHDADNYAALNSLKKINPGLRVLASVGGWTWSGGFSDLSLTSAGRSKFIESAVRFVTRYKLDGIDIDWEYPGMPGIGNPHRPADKVNYTSLMRELRARFDHGEKTVGRKLITSVAAGASLEFLTHTEMDKVAMYVDTVNLMTYDYYESSSDKITGHHAPLHTNPMDPKSVSAEASVVAYVATGVPPQKLVLGVPFYGHAWSDVRDMGYGLFQPGKPSKLEASYKTITEVLLKTGYIRHWDKLAGAPYLYSSEAQSFVSYDDVESISLKARFVIQKQLRGIMFWEYHSDDNGTLLNAMWRGLRN